MLLPTTSIIVWLLRSPETAENIERSEEHTSELQSQSNLVCRLLLEKKKKKVVPTRSDSGNIWHLVIVPHNFRIFKAPSQPCQPASNSITHPPSIIQLG